jgi:hypothetical protein
MSRPMDSRMKTSEQNYAQAAIISKEVEIRNVLLAECQASRQPGLLADMDLRIDVRVTPQYDAKAKVIVLRTCFSLLGRCQSKEALKISATLILLYSIAKPEVLNPERLKLFGELNGAYNAWPYWREFVQSTGARMGLPQLIVPTFRVGRGISKNAVTPPRVQEKRIANR